MALLTGENELLTKNVEIARRNRDTAEAEVAIKGLLGVHEVDAFYLEDPCHWCNGLGLDAMLPNRVTIQFEDSWLAVDTNGQIINGSYYRLFFRLAAMSMTQAGWEAGAVLCQFSELCDHLRDLAALGWTFDRAIPKREWACPRCKGTGGSGKRRGVDGQLRQIERALNA